MSRNSGSNRNAVGYRLQEIRKQKGVKGRELAAKIRCSPSKVSQIENGYLKPTFDYVEKFSKALGLTQSEASDLRIYTELFLLDLDKWRLDISGTLQDLQERVQQLERSTVLFRSFQWVVIPGLIQTPEYMGHLYPLLGKPSEKDIKAGIKRRIERQNILSDPNRSFFFIISENAFGVTFYPEHVIIDQCAHISEISKLPNVSIKILPFRQKLHTIPPTGFDILDNRLVLIETSVSVDKIWQEDQVLDYINQFKTLDRSAIDYADNYRWLCNEKRDFVKPSYSKNSEEAESEGQ